MTGNFLKRLCRARAGSVAIEFALIGPAVIAMLLGVMQVGIGMQNYNALRGISGDMARYSMVQYQTGNKLSDGQLTAYARSIATRSPYSLDDTRLTTQILTPATQRVAGATEKTIVLTYEVPTVLAIIGLSDIPISYSRPVFLLV